MHATQEADVLVHLLTDPKTENSRGTLLYALEEIGKKVPLDTLVDLILRGSYEARQEALQLLASGRTTFSQTEVRKAKEKLQGSSSSDEEDSEVIQKAIKAIHNLQDSPTTRGSFRERLPVEFKGRSRSTVTLKQLAADLAGSHEMSKKQTEAVLSNLIELVIKHLKKGDRIRIGGLGVLVVRKRAARMGRNPATGEMMQIKASRKVAFRPAKHMKEVV